VLTLLAISPAGAQSRLQTDFEAEDFQARREKIYDVIGENLAVIQGAEDVQGSIIFRQSNTFYYLSGLVIPTAYMVMDGRSRETTLYLTHRDPIQKTNGGESLSFEARDLVMKMTGVDDVQPLEIMAKDLSWEVIGSTHPALYTPFSPDEKYRQSRDGMLAGFARRASDPWDGRPSKAGHFINLLELRFPQYEIRDLSPALDEMRTIKDEKEIALIRTASQLASMGIMEAMRSTEPGVMEYQLAAAADFIFKTNGARGSSYNPIVGGGKNAWYGHYSANSDPLLDGDLLLMDLAPDYHYYTSDLARMWPVNGTYSEDQRDLYGFVIDFHKAFMRHIRPGITPTELMDKVTKDMRKVLDGMSFSKEIYREACEEALEFTGHFQHPVGMSVHDVGRLWGKPLQPGMVFSIDPMVWVRPEELYIRMEDIVVVTENGVERLSANLPIEMDEIERIIRGDGIVQARPAAFN